MDETVYQVKLTSAYFDDTDTLYVCLSSGFGLQLVEDKDYQPYRPWETLDSAMQFVRELTSMEEADSDMMRLRRAIKQEISAINETVTAAVINTDTDEVLGSFTYTPNPPLGK